MSRLGALYESGGGNEKLRQKSLDAGIYSFRAQLFGIAENTQTYPLSSAETVSFTAVSEVFDDIPHHDDDDDDEVKKTTSDRSRRGETSMACTSFSSCADSENTNCKFDSDMKCIWDESNY